jgi:hypothetical protein
MSVFSDIGNALITAATGSSPGELQAQAAQAEQQLSIAIATMIGLEAIIVFELLVLVAMSWKERH